MLETDRPIALREAIRCVRNGGIGVYGGFVDKFPIGVVMNRGLTIKAAQCHVQRYRRPLLVRIEAGEIDPVSSSPIICRCPKRRAGSRCSWPSRTAARRSSCTPDARSEPPSLLAVHAIGGFLAGGALSGILRTWTGHALDLRAVAVAVGRAVLIVRALVGFLRCFHTGKVDTSRCRRRSGASSRSVWMRFDRVSHG
jgi:hypothetical protein